MTDDASLLRAFRAGDDQAFALLAERYHRAVRAACQRQAPKDEVDDCLQAVFLILVRRPAAAARAPVLLAWLHRVAHFVCRDARRAAARRSRRRLAEPAPSGPGHHPEAIVLERLDLALLRLEERQRAAVLLHASGDGSEEIAQHLGVTTEHARKLVQRGLSALRERLCRTSSPISAAALLAMLGAGSAEAATATTLTITTLNAATVNASLLAKGTLMHLTLTAAKTWIVAAALAATVGLGGVVAAEALATPPPAPAPRAERAPDGDAARPELAKRLDDRLTLDLKDLDLPAVARVIRERTGLSVVIAPAVAARTVPRVSLEAKDQSLRQVLDRIMKQTGLRYVLQDQALVISIDPDAPAVAAEPPAADEPPPITLKVSDMAIEDTAKFMSLLTNVPITIDPSLKGQRLSLDFQDHPLVEALEFLARVTGGEVKPLAGDPPGYQIVPKAPAAEREPSLPTTAQ